MGKILDRNTIQPPNISIKYQMKCFFFLFCSFFLFFFLEMFRFFLLYFCSTHFSNSTFGMYALTWRLESHKFDLFIKKKVFQTPFNFNMNELFFLIWMVDALVKFCISVADSCTDASFALGQLWWIAHTHTPEFQVIRKSFAAFTRKMAINISFPLWFLITFPVKIQWFFFSHCKVTFKRTLVESLVACSMISIWCQIYEKRFSSYLKY